MNNTAAHVVDGLDLGLGKRRWSTRSATVLERIRAECWSALCIVGRASVPGAADCCAPKTVSSARTKLRRSRRSRPTPRQLRRCTPRGPSRGNLPGLGVGVPVVRRASDTRRGGGCRSRRHGSRWRTQVWIRRPRSLEQRGGRRRGPATGRTAQPPAAPPSAGRGDGSLSGVQLIERRLPQT